MNAEQMTTNLITSMLATLIGQADRATLQLAQLPLCTDVHANENVQKSCDAMNAIVNAAKSFQAAVKFTAETGASIISQEEAQAAGTRS